MRWTATLAAFLPVLAAVSRAQEPAAVLLRLHPRVGDTLHMVLDQQTEVSVAPVAGAAASARPVRTAIAIHSQTIVRSVRGASTVVLTIVDSVRLSSSDAHAAARAADTQRAFEGQQMELQLGADGRVESARDARGALVPRQVSDAMAAMPAVFPQKPVHVGEQWTRELALPASGPLAGSGSGRAKATFRLDSLGRRGSTAFVSMRGDILPESGGSAVALSGSIAGTMQLDRNRGWMTESRVLVTLESLVTPPLASGLAPTRFLTRVTQHLSTMDKR